MFSMYLSCKLYYCKYKNIILVLYYKISDWPAFDRKIRNMSENNAFKYSKPVTRVDYQHLTKICNPPDIIEHGDEGNIGI